MRNLLRVSGLPTIVLSSAAIYHGVLLSISDEEADKLQAELVSNGYLPEAKVEEQSSFGSHD